MKQLGKSPFFKITIAGQHGTVWRACALLVFGPSITYMREDGTHAQPLSRERFQEGIDWIYGWPQKGAPAVRALQAAHLLARELE